MATDCPLTILRGVKPKGIVLLAPFSTLESLLDDYHIFGIIPILQPLQTLPFLSSKFHPGSDTMFLIDCNRVLETLLDV